MGQCVNGIDLAREFFAMRRRRQMRQQLLHGLEWKRDDEKFGDERAGARVYGPLGNGFVPLGGFDVGVEMDGRSALFRNCVANRRVR